MKIFLSNDDGYSATGLKTLIRHLITNNSPHTVTVVAPDRDKSASSNSLTLKTPLLPIQFNYPEFQQYNDSLKKCYFVDGTPTDCVHVGITGLLKDNPDIVIAGINSGANMGDDVLYSGTIAAATEGRFLGLPSIAVSLVINSEKHMGNSDDIFSENKINYDTAGIFVRNFLKHLGECPIPENTILNINVPDKPWNEIKGIKITRLGKRHKSEPAIASKDPRNRSVFWLGPVGKEADAGPGTDFHAVNNGYISITPLKIDLTDKELLEPLDNWLKSKEIKDFLV